METVSEIIGRAVAELLGRSSGPLHFRLVIQPIVATILAVRAGLRDAREDKPAFLWAVLTDRNSRAQFLRSGWKDISKIFVIAMVLDAVYQAIVLHGFHVIQTLMVAVAVAVIPYVVVRGPVNRIAGRSRTGQTRLPRPAGPSRQGGGM